MKIQNPETVRCRGGRAQDVGLFCVVCDERHDGGGDEAEGGDDPLPPRRAHQGAAPRGRERGEDTQPPLKGDNFALSPSLMPPCRVNFFLFKFTGGF